MCFLVCVFHSFSSVWVFFDSDSSGHSNRIFVVKFHPTDPNILLSAGWDNSVMVPALLHSLYCLDLAFLVVSVVQQFWDIRQQSTVRNISGPHICGLWISLCSLCCSSLFPFVGEALDVHEELVLTGSWRPDSPLEVCRLLQ